MKLQKVRIEAGRTRASLDGTIDALHDFNCDPEKYCKGHDSCAPCSVTRLEIEGCAPDLGYWLRRFGLPAFVESACSSQSSPGAPIVITGPLTKPKMTVATELTGLPCVDKLSILDSQFDAASGVLDIRRMKSGALGGTLEGSGRIRTGETPVIEKLNVTGRKLDPQKICGLGTMVKGTIDAVDVELAGTIVKRDIDPGRVAEFGFANRATSLQRWMTHTIRGIARSTPLFVPWIYAVLAIAAIALARRRAILALALSGIGMEASLIPLVHNDDYRYSHWMVVATLVALVATIVQRAAQGRSPSPEDHRHEGADTKLATSRS